MRPLRRQPQRAGRRHDPGGFRRLDPHDAADRMQQLPAAVDVQRDRVADREGARHHRDLARGVVHIAAVNRPGFAHGTIATKIGRTSLNGKG
jgi:hypothetical protein